MNYTLRVYVRLAIDKVLCHQYTMFQGQMNTPSYKGITAEGQADGERDGVEGVGVGSCSREGVAPTLDIAEVWRWQCFVNQSVHEPGNVAHDSFIGRLPVLVAIRRGHLRDQQPGTSRGAFGGLLVLPGQPGDGMGFVDIDKGVIGSRSGDGLIAQHYREQGIIACLAQM